MMWLCTVSGASMYCAWYTRHLEAVSRARCIAQGQLRSFWWQRKPAGGKAAAEIRCSTQENAASRRILGPFILIVAGCFFEAMELAG